VSAGKAARLSTGQYAPSALARKHSRKINTYVLLWLTLLKYAKHNSEIYFSRRNFCRLPRVESFEVEAHLASILPASQGTVGQGVATTN
jgi:hypothetical protein